MRMEGTTTCRADEKALRRGGVGMPERWGSVDRKPTTLLRLRLTKHYLTPAVWSEICVAKASKGNLL